MEENKGSVTVEKPDKERKESPIGYCSMCGEHWFSLRKGVCPACLKKHRDDVEHSA